MSSEHATAPTEHAAAPSEAEMRAAYEAELNRITSGEMILQSTVSLLNIGGRRLGLGSAPTPDGAPAPLERDLEQACDAIDAVRALMPILERRMPTAELAPLRDAIAQLQMAYAREAQGAHGAPAPASTQAGSTQQPTTQRQGAPEQPGATPAQQQPEGPGPAQASGRLWVPGR